MILNIVLLLSAAYNCPIVETKPDLNITEYTREKWYVQYQQETSYLPERLNYCVTAQYGIKDDTHLSVYNYANLDKVNGESTNRHHNLLCARIPDENIKSKLVVSPCFLPDFFSGDYWVIDAGPENDNYTWAIISGGQPYLKLDDGCTTETRGFNNTGFWFFTRDQLPNNNLVEIIKEKAIKKGFTLEKMNPIIQEGCLYN